MCGLDPGREIKGRPLITQVPMERNPKWTEPTIVFQKPLGLGRVRLW
jgi:hypothetical protein